MRPIFYLLPLALAACQPVATSGPQQGAPVPEGQVRIASIQASASTLRVRMSNGASCEAVRPEEITTGWSGVMGEGCGYRIPFTVTFRQGATPQRFTIEAAPAGTGPRAEVYLTDVDGVRRLFSAPLGPNVRFEQAS